jgi:DNA-binding NtrC family response regulator
VELLASQYTADPKITGFVFGEGKIMLSLNAMTAEVARTEIPVLVLGESGTGKDAYASLIHRLSTNCKLPLKKINCSGVEPSELLAQVNESIHKLSNQDLPGTLYLDNIQELDLGCQRVLLSHLPDVEGAGSKLEACPRLISSTSKNLESEVETGRFLRELFFRLNGACLRLPALRDRREDIPNLTYFFLKKHSSILKKNPSTLNAKAMQTLDAYHWPGNIRELENAIRKIVVFGDTQSALNDLRPAKASNLKMSVNGKSESLKVASRAASRQAERELIMQALERTRWNRKRAAQELQISYKSLLYKLKEIGPSNGEQKEVREKNQR